MKKLSSKIMKKFKGQTPSKGKFPPLTDRDVFLVSYPRSGNTWVRFLIANLLKPEGIEIDFHNVQEYVPEINRNNDIIESLPSPRVIKSHALYKSAFPKVIYLVRDGRDVYVSYFYYRLKQLEEGTSFSEYIRRKDHFPSLWNEHVESWLTWDHAQPNLLLVRYEDLLSKPEVELRKIANFIGIQRSDEVISNAVEVSRFDKMREIDQTKGRKYNLTGTKDFVRKGKAGTWQEEFSREDIEFFKENAGDLLIRLGYESDLDW